ncbi:conjugative transposon protein TraM [Pedobacter sp. ISL-68]|uniref:conjugative transposon protein TraM n=1 Tax=unclassified Pedobacter TaxID=2628915 RepID=UPI001BED300D|nr:MULTISPECIES: conjugative transposon protein TraM [unclassified Pedobacter]MBT2560130.1 conjugative transposon protein TraM [Pedobacter sp. ISL-64]MBT2589109.1 conjugative transposon protein TraM [Pedobacter sp. ISL-68]
MKINFKQPKYILPLVILPFLCLFFYVWHSSSAKTAVKPKTQAGIQDNVGDVSPGVKKQAFSDKLDAFRNTFKEADGYTAVSPIGEEQSAEAGFTSQYNSAEKHMLDSIDRQMKSKFQGGMYKPAAPDHLLYPGTGTSHQEKGVTGDKALAAALSNLSRQRKEHPVYQQADTPPSAAEKDPMELFKAQMAYMDSAGKAADPQYKAEMQKSAALAKAEALRKSQPIMEVRKAQAQSSDFNTIMPAGNDGFIMAIIDENVTGYAGSRIRVRLLDDIYAGRVLIKKGTYLYALVSGFQGQRVTLTVQSVLTGKTILPVKLEVYDQDGLPGLYVPASAFRDFTKDLSGNSMQGFTIDGGAQNGSQFLMSTLDKMFQSTSSAIASAIRKNKAKIKYNSYIYLIDPQAQQNALQNQH